MALTELSADNRLEFQIIDTFESWEGMNLLASPRKCKNDKYFKQSSESRLRRMRIINDPKILGHCSLSLIFHSKQAADFSVKLFL